MRVPHLPGIFPQLAFFAGAPWMISVPELEKEEVLEAVERIKRRMNRKSPRCDNHLEKFP